MQVWTANQRTRPDMGNPQPVRGKVFVCLLLVTLIACAAGGCAFVNIKTPYDRDLDRTELGSKVGVAEAYSIFWLVAWGDASYETAARNGDISVINHADQEIFQIFFGFYTRWRVVVYGN